MGRSVRRPIRRARIFLPRISCGRTFALHRNLRGSGVRDALHDDPFHEALARGAGIHRGGIGSRQSCVEDEINLGRRLRPLRGCHHDGLTRALAQRPATGVPQLLGLTSNDARKNCFAPDQEVPESRYLFGSLLGSFGGAALSTPLGSAPGAGTPGCAAVLLLIETNSTSKISVEFGAIPPPAPRCPYARSDGTN